MLATFFQIAMISLPRQIMLRKAVVVHILLLSGLAVTVERHPTSQSLTNFGQFLVAIAIVEASILCGWRLTQLPKSQALEFLLVSPIQPGRLFLAEASVGLSRFLLVQLSGLPILLMMVSVGFLQSFDIGIMLLLPFVWGTVAALGLVVWSYETLSIRRVGEVVAIVGVVVYLVVGVLAAEHLRDWLMALPPDIGQFLYDAFREMHDGNPFGVMAYWLNPRSTPSIAWEMDRDCLLVGMGLSVLFMLRASFRLRGHFADRHYRPFATNRPDELDRIGDKPLTWWAVKRVMEFSGRVNIWLAGGFSLVYGAYIMAGDAWPVWMGHLVFEIFEKMGGVPALITGLVVLSAVPAAFQYGLWDSSTQDRCRRLELLLLTDLDAHDYWNASLAAAWKRGKGYLFIAGFLEASLLIAARIDVLQLLVTVYAALVVWVFGFLLGFLAFSGGHQAKGLGSILTLGMPLIVGIVYNQLGATWAMFLPLGVVYSGLVQPPVWSCLALVPYTFFAWHLRNMALRRCEGDLRLWYDRNQGLKVLD